MRALAGKGVIVTGASRGLGAVIARDLARTGAHLILAARSEARLETLAAELREGGAVVTVVPADVTSATDRARLVAAAEAAAPVAVLVNNAGIEIPVAVADQTDDDVACQLEVNLRAPIHLTRAVLPALLDRGEGAVVTVSSMSGKSPTPYNAIYAAAKHGVNGFTASLRIELAGTGVHAGVVCPSFVSEAGMWSETGLQAPALLREVPPSKVAAGVRRVIAGAPEVLVTPGPVRPLLALAQLFPRLEGWVLRRMGVLDTLKARARVTDERR